MAKKMGEIKDSYFVTYGIFYSMGVLTYVPHHFFTTSTDYWMFKFRDPSRDGMRPPPRPRSSHNSNYGYIDSGYAKERTPLQASFTSSFFITCQISMLGFLVVTALFSKKLPPPPKRILGALLSMLVLFLINTAFTWIDTDSFQEAFFAATMVLAVLLNITSAVTMMSLFELVTKFPLDYYAAILSGQALCGIISSLVQIFTLSIDSSSLTFASIYFGMGSFLILCTSIFYLITKKKSKYFIYRIGQHEQTSNGVTRDKWNITLVKVKGALYRTKWILVSLVIVQGSTACIHPGLAALVVSEYKDDEDAAGEWSETYFVPVVTFFCFHLSDFIGREAARKIKRPRNCLLILALAVLRISLVPLLVLSNAQPRNHMPVFFGDKVYIFIIILFGCTQGFLVNLCIISVPMVAKKDELEFVTILVPLVSVIAVTVCSAFNMMIINLI